MATYSTNVPRLNLLAVAANMAAAVAVISLAVWMDAKAMMLIAVSLAGIGAIISRTEGHKMPCLGFLVVFAVAPLAGPLPALLGLIVLFKDHKAARSTDSIGLTDRLWSRPRRT